MTDLTKPKFGRLTVQDFAGSIKYMDYWNCLCDCGSTVKVQGGHLRAGHTQSCGCFQRERVTKHGQARDWLRTTEYIRWQNMMQRCYNPKFKSYKNYGGRGIKVCDRWHMFENFSEDMGPCPPGMTLDRKDNNLDYCLENCRWVTMREQQNNRRDNIWYWYRGEKRTVAQWATHLGINDSTLRGRLSKWSVERAFTTPVKKRLK